MQLNFSSMRFVLIFAPLLIGASCSGGTNMPTGNNDSFAGTYATTVSLGQNSCGAVTIQDMPTVVTHNKSTGAVSFAHSGLSWTGSVDAQNNFTTTPTTLDANGFHYVIALAGHFTASGFTATVTLDRTLATGAGQCQYVVNWIGTR